MKIKLMIFLLVISFFSGCKTHTDYYYGVEYIFKNNTEYQIEINSFGNIYSTNDKLVSRLINRGDSISLKFDGEISEEYREMQTELDFLVENLKAYRFFGDSLKVFFNQKKLIKITLENNAFIYDKSLYESKRLGAREFRHSYIFTDEDYDKAIPISTD